jgi:NAD(P)-dependent dehydrogenase (short-subunit alcohol dehydrogenase family)
MRLEHQVAIVTGAGRNIGEEICKVFAREGAKVAVVDLDEARGSRVAREINGATPNRATSIVCDVASADSVDSMVQTVIKTLGGVDILVNNAAWTDHKTIFDITEEEYDRLFAINAKAAFFCMQEAARRMADNGRIINLETSLVGATTPYYSAYAGSKAPLEDFTRALAKEIGNRGITVNNIAPGPLNTSFFYPAETQESTEYFKQQSINGQLGEVRDIVPLVQFLVSPESRWVTAQTIFINGGFLTR